MDPKNNIPENETRSYSIDLAELRSDNNRSVEGYAIVFNSESRDLGGFTEVILPSAIEGVIEKSDILALVDHNRGKGVLARSTNGKGSLKIIIDNKGVKYNFSSPNFSLGDELLEGIKRGDIRSSSFGFLVSAGQKWEKRSDGSYLRTITKFDYITDVSPCYREAYQDTSVALRNLDTFIKSVIPEDPIPKPLPEDPGIGNFEIGSIKRSDQERYLRQLQYSLKIKNK